MTDKGIQLVIDCFNRPNNKMVIISQPIGPNIHFALVWTDGDYYKIGDISPYKFYFISDAKNKCIGAVLDMWNDLHWYITPQKRKKGYLTEALKNYILPHLSQSRSEQKITINKRDIGDENYQSSYNTAKRTGFILKNSNSESIEFLQKLRKHKKAYKSPVLEGMDFEEIDELRKKMNFAISNIQHIQAALEMRLGNSIYTRGLNRTIKNLENYRTYKLSDALHDFLDDRKFKNGI